MIKNSQIDFQSKEYLEFRDITDEVEKIIKEAKIKNGNVLVFSTHTTVAICVNEKEKGIVIDFKNLMTKLIPKDNYYQHNDLSIRTENLVCQSAASDCLNGHSHCTHLLMRNSETIPIVKGKMTLGTWQRIFAIELDCGRNRKIVVQIIGE
ncbi:MAG: secondary thiamine-phosphate synthase enzyme YjbQ [Candidatus Shapirobacteria bacterium]|nr:secondary thiamine-phosphate synthase enzyme YjbQ [Candidatus Shapirobacteria bacterium]